MGLISGIIDRMANKAEQEASLLLADYREMLSTSAEAQSIKLIAGTDGGHTAAAERAATAHKQLFQELLRKHSGTSLARSKQRSIVLEKFCAAMWIKYIGQDAYAAMLERLKQGWTAARR
ncbi:MAG TPA: hypothetical protein VHJ40_07955 [Actinomycetota bacterium]|jgi:hypothetical protein|nr:hypothetical protein [Actinomycetota bacterium]